MKCTFHEDTETIVDHKDFVVMQYKVSTNNDDEEWMEIKYFKDACAIECLSAEDFYGQGARISFGSLDRFKKYLEGKGYEVR